MIELRLSNPQVERSVLCFYMGCCFNESYIEPMYLAARDRPIQGFSSTEQPE